MVNCPRCGAACGDGDSFCSSCGTPLTQRTESGAAGAGSGNGGAFGSNGYGSAYGPDGYVGSYGPDGNSGAYGPNGYGGAYGPNGYGGAYGPDGYGGAYGPNGYGGPYGYAPYQLNTTGIRKRNIALAIIFSIITFGIYGIYWMIKINNEVNQLADEPGATSGGLVFLFSLITFGIYSIYWLYRMGQRCDRIKRSSSTEILYVLLGIFGLSIIAYALIQDTINQTVGI